MRAFVALTLPEAARGALLARQTALRPALEGAVRWTPPAQLHITLQFLGDIPRDRTAPLTAALQHAATGAPVIEAAWQSTVGMFPNPQAPRVLWVGLQQGEAAVNALAGRLLGETAALGLHAQARAFHAHATLGRVRSPAEAARVGRALQVTLPATEELRGQAGAPFTLETLALMESALTPQGPIHTPLATLQLGW